MDKVKSEVAGVYQLSTKGKKLSITILEWSFLIFPQIFAVFTYYPGYHLPLKRNFFCLEEREYKSVFPDKEKFYQIQITFTFWLFGHMGN